MVTHLQVPRGVQLFHLAKLGAEILESALFCGRYIELAGSY